MSEASRINKGRPLPKGHTGPIGGSLSMKLPGKGEITRGREGDWPPSFAESGDAMGAIAPGCKAGKVTKMD